MFKKEPEFVPGTAAAPTSTVEISISCRGLINKDILSKSDPMCVVYHQPPGYNHFIELIRSEIIQNDLNPDFAEKATLEYYFEEKQLMRFEIYDVDKPSTDLDKHDFLGHAECTIAQIVSSGSSGYSIPLNDANIAAEKAAGTIILTAEELASLKDEATIRLGGSSLGFKSCLCLSPTTYFTISRLNEAGKYVLSHRSKEAKGHNPEWESCTISLRRLCNGNKDLTVKIEVFQSQFSRSGKSLGYSLTTLQKMVENGTVGLPLSRDDGKKTTGSVVILLCKISPIYTFLDYIQNGTQIHCCISIDFTSSNGHPRDKSSLHFSSEGEEKPNPYEQAIQAVGGIIEDYATDKLFPVYGFGAKIPPQNQVSHNFFVTLADSGYCYGIPGVLEGYRNCLNRIELYAPTNFAPVIKHVSELAGKHQNGDHYFVLLIITDGVITDMPQTKEAIVNASTNPVSIIIVGVGFEVGKGIRDRIRPPTPNEKTDGFGASQRKEKFNENVNKMAQERLAQEVLAEIPEQLTSFMKSKGLVPGNIQTKTFLKPA